VVLTYAHDLEEIHSSRTMVGAKVQAIPGILISPLYKNLASLSALFQALVLLGVPLPSSASC
jgi:hypothetical protein